MYNRWEGIGNLGADPETRYLQSGAAVTEIRIACSERWRDRQTGEQQERTEWVTCTAFGRLAEVMGEYLRKGSQVFVAGRLQTDSWEDKQTGQKRYRTKVIANELKMLGGGRGGGGQQRQERPAQQQHSGRPRDDSAVNLPEDDDFDDDIPF